MELQSPRSLREFFQRVHEGDLVHLVLRKDFEAEHRGRETVVVPAGDLLTMNALHTGDVLGYVCAINESLPGQIDHHGILGIRSVDKIIVPVPWHAIEEVRTFTLDQTYQLTAILSMPRYSPGA